MNLKEELIQEIIGLSKGHKDYINKITKDHNNNCEVIKYYIQTKLDVLSKEVDKDKKDFISKEIELNNKELEMLSVSYSSNLEIAKADYIAQVAEKFLNIIRLTKNETD